MAICNFFQQGTCKHGNNCRFEHVSPKPFGSKAGGNTSVPISKYNEKSITDNFKDERPQWKLSVYGPAKEEPNLIVNVDRSVEEDRLLYYSSMRTTGNEQQYITSHQQLSNQVESQVNAILNNPSGAVQHYEQQKSNHSGPFSGTSTTPFAPFLGGGGGSGSAFGQNSAFGAGTNPSFGAKSTFGSNQAVGSNSAFGQAVTSNNGSAFGSTSALGGGGSAFGSTSALGGGGSAFGSTSTLGGGGSAFGSTSALGGGGLTFGSTSALGGGGTAFGSTSALGGGGAAFGSTSALGGGPSFGSNSALGASGGSGFSTLANNTPAPAFGSSTGAFGTTTTSTLSTFGSTPTPGSNQPPKVGDNTGMEVSGINATSNAHNKSSEAAPTAEASSDVPSTLSTEISYARSTDHEQFAAEKFTIGLIPMIEPPMEFR